MLKRLRKPFLESRPERIKVKKLENKYEDVFDRQQRLKGWDQRKFQKKTVSLIGAGINGEVAYGLAKEGIGKLRFFDFDLVEPSNLNRQFFTREDLYHNKAIALARNLSRYAVGDTELMAFPYRVQSLIKKALDCDLAICLVDNDDTRAFVAQQFWKKGIPVIFGAVTDGATGCNVVIQKNDGICYGCARPDVLEDSYNPCAKAPSVVRSAKLCAGIALYASDMLVLEKDLPWNYFEVFLDGSIFRALKLAKRENCTLCHNDRTGD